MSSIIYTHTDEAPALATHSFLPIVQAFAAHADVQIETRDISLSSRILAVFSDLLPPDQRVSDDLRELGTLAKTSEANIIKLPNISASIPQLIAAITELQKLGFKLPNYPENPNSDVEKDAKSRYDRVKGSAVNPVLREGNSDRRAPAAVKAYAKKHPHSMGPWKENSKTHVAHMQSGDFYGSEQSLTCKQATQASILFTSKTGVASVLKDEIPLISGEIIDTAIMSLTSLKAFVKEQMRDAREKETLFSVHLKATMMKVSDPIIFGAFVEVFFETVFEQHGDTLETIGADPRNGLGDLYSKIESLSHAERSALETTIQNAFEQGPELAMVNSDKGITNLHVPSDIIIDASMPAMIRNSGQMWDSFGNPKDTKAVIPDRSYAGVYSATIEFCKKNGALDPRTMGSVSNIGLMAQKAEEYGSHDKTFQLPEAGKVQVVDSEGNVLLEQSGDRGDIFRMCQVKDAPIQNWVKLGVERARATGNPAVFWLDDQRAHDSEILRKVNQYLPDHDTSGLNIQIMSPVEATHYSLERIVQGQDTISVTGNVLRDYLTDLFPILEVGTSAKMLSIVPLMNGGGLFETGAGGSAPKHVQQLNEENYLRWDSLGEFLALAVSLEHLATVTSNPKAKILGRCLDEATTEFLDEDKSPTRRIGGIDNRGSHFYLALFWAKAISNQTEDASLSGTFTTLFQSLSKFESSIVTELNDVQGQAADTGGYYRLNKEKTVQIMRPSPTFNDLIDSFKQI